MFYKKNSSPFPEVENRDLLHLIKANDVVLELGARFGGTTLVLMEKCKFVYSFEANPFSFKNLETTLEKWTTLKNARVFNLGIGDKNRPEQLYLTKNPLSPVSSFERVSGDYSYNLKHAHLVQRRTLDSLEFDFPISVVWMDIEGSAKSPFICFRISQEESYQIIPSRNSYP